ncbi:hypothetical protein QCE73_38170 [Caballeronia sp. LZ029]|uniref:hypothetical protein n=1 Tax=unclassified Caballeronia TaxID=2646786 RepID=UPI001F234F3B|nr:MULTISPECIES: hypothetical protein [unclassified Caballeronia]MCE4575248.1 hypothetical protein [Caballeronia sp. CLC5]MDR5748987.1 hypothetical protein [Caballeronia sp. LZ029]
MGLSQEVRRSAAIAANAEDADIWRWFANLVEERRIRWCLANGSWLVSVDHRHVATDKDFDVAIRGAKVRTQRSNDETLRGNLLRRSVA